MLALSAAYNMWPITPTKWILRRFDHSAIYLLIAGTYTPFLALMKSSLLSEVAEYTGGENLDLIERRCRDAVDEVKEEWQRRHPDAADAAAVEAFYHTTDAYIYDLMWVIRSPRTRRRSPTSSQ